MGNLIALSLLLYALLAFNSCEKQDRSNDRFVCNVNGKTWKPANSDLKYGRDVSAHLIDEGKTFYLDAYQEVTRQTVSLSIMLDREVSPGIYTLEAGKQTAEFMDAGKGLKFKTQIGSTGTLEILKLDKATNTVQGRFSFIAKEQSTAATADITNGNFKLQYTNY